MHNIDSYKLANLIKIAHGIVEDPIKLAIKQDLAASCTIIVKAANDEWTGSGFHIGNGYIGTASHVADPALINTSYQMHVTFDGKNKIPAKIIVSNPNTEAAIIYAEGAKDIIPIMMGDSNKVEKGDIIAVIGAPEGWHDNVTVGRISNLHQNLGEFAPSPAWNDMIFIDAEILQGVSGGMVITTDAKVIGMVLGQTGIHADVGVGQNAIIPINRLRELLDTLSLKGGK